MSMYDHFKTDPELEKAGVWIDYSDEYRIRLARAGGANKAFQKQLERASRKYRRLLATDNMPPETVKKLMRETFAKTVVLDWETKVGDEMVKGIENPEGGDLLPVNYDNILATFEILPDLFEDLQSQAQSIANFRAAIREEAAGN